MSLKKDSSKTKICPFTPDPLFYTCLNRNKVHLQSKSSPRHETSVVTLSYWSRGPSFILGDWRRLCPRLQSGNSLKVSQEGVFFSTTAPFIHLPFVLCLNGPVFSVDIRFRSVVLLLIDCKGYALKIGYPHRIAVSRLVTSLLD